MCGQLVKISIRRCGFLRRFRNQSSGRLDGWFLWSSKYLKARRAAGKIFLDEPKNRVAVSAEKCAHASRFVIVVDGEDMASAVLGRRGFLLAANGA